MGLDISTPPLQQSLPVSADKMLANWPKPWANFFTVLWQIAFAAGQSGTTANRPDKDLWIGRTYFDESLGIPIWYDGTQWVDATGTPA
jgi:hypothetical protein